MREQRFLMTYYVLWLYDVCRIKYVFHSEWCKFRDFWNANNLWQPQKASTVSIWGRLVTEDRPLAFLQHSLQKIRPWWLCTVPAICSKELEGIPFQHKTKKCLFLWLRTMYRRYEREAAIMNRYGMRCDVCTNGIVCLRWSLTIYHL